MGPRIRLLLPALMLALLALSCRGVHAQTGDRTLTLEFAGRTRSAIVHVPPSYSANRSTPLVLLLHGGGGNGAQAERAYGMNPIADREGFLVVYPNGTSGFGNFLTWDAANCCAYAYENHVDDVGFIRALIERLEHDYAVDPRRIFATGMSNGGMMTYRLGCQLSDKLAAIAPVSGSLNDTSCTPIAPLPIIVFHGTADQHVPYYGGFGSASLYPHEDRPVSYAVDFWVTRDGCSTTPVSETSASGNIVKDAYGGGAAGSEVVLYTVVGGGHAWPGSSGSVTGDVPTQEISASELMWAFFARHPKVAPDATMSIRVESPNGGEKLRRGRTYPISWSIEAPGAIVSQEIWLSADGGVTYPTRLATVTDPDARSYAWTVPADQTKGKRYRIRVIVTPANGVMAVDESDGNFRVKR